MTGIDRAERLALAKLARLDDVFGIVIFVIPVLITFLVALGIPPVKGLFWKTALTVTLLTVTAVIVWSVGYVSADQHTTTLKLTGWFLWSDATALLLVVVFWGIYEMLGLLANITWISILPLVASAILTWWKVGSLYGRRNLDVLILSALFAAILPGIAFGP